MSPGGKQQLMREILQQSPPTEPEIINILRHFDPSARRHMMEQAGVVLEKSDVIKFLHKLNPPDIQGLILKSFPLSPLPYSKFCVPFYGILAIQLKNNTIRFSNLFNSAPPSPSLVIFYATPLPRRMCYFFT